MRIVENWGEAASSENEKCASLRQRRRYLLSREFQPRVPHSTCLQMRSLNLINLEWYIQMQMSSPTCAVLIGQGRSVYWLSGSIVTREQGTSLQSLPVSWQVILQEDASSVFNPEACVSKQPLDSSFKFRPSSLQKVNPS